MKIRSSLLVACIVVVPLIAMFSHRVPPAVRTAALSWLRDTVRGGRPQAPVAPAPVAAPMQPVAAMPATTGGQTADGPNVVPVVAVVAPPSHASLRRLQELGAVEIDCRPLPGAGGHVASCRVPVDGAGQLQRVFQAAGEDPSAAADKLLHDVHSWRSGAPAAAPRTVRF